MIRLAKSAGQAGLGTINSRGSCTLRPPPAVSTVVSGTPTTFLPSVLTLDLETITYGRFFFCSDPWMSRPRVNPVRHLHPGGSPSKNQYPSNVSDSMSSMEEARSSSSSSVQVYGTSCSSVARRKIKVDHLLGESVRIHFHAKTFYYRWYHIGIDRHPETHGRGQTIKMKLRPCSS